MTARSPHDAPTVVVVHAHPDDESLFTGLRLLHAAENGQRTVLVTCTDGALGFDPAGRGALDPAHDAAATATQRHGELLEAAALLRIDRVVTLGYGDSGMEGWASAHEPSAFVQQDPDDVAAELAEIFREEGPCEVVTYALDGFYGHPDHIHVARCVLRAAARTPHVQGVEAVVMTQEAIDSALDAAHATGGELPEWLGKGLVVPHRDDEVVRVLVAPKDAALKQAAIGAHTSQLDNKVLAAMDAGLFADVFGTERYIALEIPLSQE